MNSLLRPVGEVIQYVRGITFKPEDKLDPGATDAVVCMRTKNIQDVLDDSDLIAVPATHVKREELFLREGDILLSSANSWNLVGKVCRVPKLNYQATAGGFISVVRAGPLVEPRYLFYWLASPEVQAKMRACARQTTNIANLSVDQFERIAIPIPRLQEQRRIAEILDRADAIRRKRKDSVTLTEELLRSMFLEMFGDPVMNPKGWAVKPLGDLMSFVTSGSRGWAKYYADSGDVFLRIQNVRSDRLDLADVAFVCAPDSAEARRTETHPGDVLLSITADLGRTCVVPDTLERAFVNQHLAILRPRDVNSDYLSTFLASEGGQRQINRKNKGGVKAGLNFDDIRSIDVLLPPRERQHAFALAKAQLRKLEACHAHARNESDDLFDALVLRSFCRGLDAKGAAC